MKYTELFNDKSDIYAAARPTYPPEIYKFLSKLCNQNERAWDSACGNGQSAISLVNFFEEVYATDVSENQIRNSFSHKKINYSVCPSEDTNFCDNYFDLICVAQALHWMKYDKFWPEVNRLLRPGGIFAAWGYCWIKVNDEIDTIINRLVLEVIAPFWADQNKLLWNHYKDLDIPFKRIETPSFEMKMNWNLNQVFAYFHSWSATRRCMDELGEDFFNNAYDATHSSWGDPNKTREIKMDFCIIVGRQEINKINS